MRDDPRVCGEDSPKCLPGMASRGRSPRVRGRPRGIIRGHRDCGTIPACAGKTRCLRHRRHKKGDDPRVCGEDTVRFSAAFVREGRSPRVRGRPPHLRGRLFLRRTIPACAGKTLIAWGWSFSLRDDPRVCGEDLTGAGGEVFGGGRSPRVRGRLYLCFELVLDLGTIPACAGKTKALIPLLIATGDDPRVCGEDGVARLI